MGIDLVSNIVQQNDRINELTYAHFDGFYVGCLFQPSQEADLIWIFRSYCELLFLLEWHCRANCFPVESPARLDWAARKVFVPLEYQQ
jgi:hypothetical protein